MVYPMSFERQEIENNFSETKGLIFDKNNFLLVHHNDSHSDIINFGYKATNDVLKYLLRLEICDYFHFTNADNMYSPNLGKMLRPYINERTELISFDFATHHQQNRYFRVEGFCVGCIDLAAAVVYKDCVIRGNLKFEPAPHPFSSTDWFGADGYFWLRAKKFALSTMSIHSVLYLHL
jgi:hypothetical protein